MAAFADKRGVATMQRKTNDAIQHCPAMDRQRDLIARLNDGPPMITQSAQLATRSDQATHAGAAQRQTHETQPQNAPELARGSGGHTGLPSNLRSGLEHLSDMDLSDVRVHYNSSKPAQLSALAYAQGNDIHLGSGQERHLPHEAWHVVQQRQGRVQPTAQLRGVEVNDNSALEAEADVMGAKARAAAEGANRAETTLTPERRGAIQRTASSANDIVQRKIGFELETDWLLLEPKPARLLEMHKPLVKGKRWNIVPDTPGAEIAMAADKHAAGNIEFVTDAFEDDELDQLATAMAEIVAFTKALKPGFLSLSNSTSLSGAVNKKNDVQWGRKSDPENEEAFREEVKRRSAIQVLPMTEPITAKPQASAGIPLDRVFDTLTAMSKGGEDNPLDSAKADSLNKRLYSLALSAANDITKVQALELAERNIPVALYKSILALLGTYIRYGANLDPSPEAATYQKAAAPLLSRTNLGHIPASIRNYPNLIADALYSGGYRGSSSENIVSQAQSTRLFRNPKMSDITAHRWLSAITKGQDPLSWEQTQDGRWDPQDVGSGSTRREGFVFEFRGLREVPVGEWVDYVLMLFILITNQLVNEREGAARASKPKSAGAKKND